MDYLAEVGVFPAVLEEIAKEMEVPVEMVDVLIWQHKMTTTLPKEALNMEEVVVVLLVIGMNLHTTLAVPVLTVPFGLPTRF